VVAGRQLCAVTGMHAATLQRLREQRGVDGLLLMRAWHAAQGRERTKVIIPDSAHGTNPASVTLGGYQTVTVPRIAAVLVDLDALRNGWTQDVAGIMLTNPTRSACLKPTSPRSPKRSTKSTASSTTTAANLNAILGVTRRGTWVSTSSTSTCTRIPSQCPTAGVARGGSRSGFRTPGRVPAGPCRCARGRHLLLEVPSRSIGRVHSWYGNALPWPGPGPTSWPMEATVLRGVAEGAVLNANWLPRPARGTYDCLDVHARLRCLDLNLKNVNVDIKW